MNVEIVTSCINCIAPGSLAATLAVILLGTGVGLATEHWKRGQVERGTDSPTRNEIAPAKPALL